MAHRGFHSLLALKALYRLLALLLLSLCTSGASFAEAPLATLRKPRIISLAPSITEIVFALHAEQHLVGVTTFCDFPPEAKKITSVGGFTDLSLEKIVSLEPSLVFGMPEHEQYRNSLSSFGVRLITTPQNSLQEILQSILTIAEPLNKNKEATNLVASIKASIAEQREAYKQDSHPSLSILVAVGGHTRGTALESTYVAGRNSLYNELLGLLGEKNAYSGPLEYATLSREGLLVTNPDVIIDLIPADTSTSTAERAQQRRDVYTTWQSLDSLHAVKNNSICVIDEEFAVNPGPRVAQTFSAIASCISRARQ